MKRFILGIIFLILICPASFAKRKAKEPVQSTQGIDLSAKIEKLKPSHKDKNEQKQQKNRSKIYILNKKKLKIEERKRNTKQKEIEYLEQRLELKKNRMETLFPTVEKGESE